MSCPASLPWLANDPRNAPDSVYSLTRLLKLSGQTSTRPAASTASPAGVARAARARSVGPGATARGADLESRGAGVHAPAERPDEVAGWRVHVDAVVIGVADEHVAGGGDADADRIAAARCAHLTGARAESAERSDVGPGQGELLHAVVEGVDDEHVARAVEGHTAGVVQLAGTGSGDPGLAAGRADLKRAGARAHAPAEGADERAGLGEHRHAVVAELADDDMARRVGRHAPRRVERARTAPGGSVAAARGAGLLAGAADPASERADEGSVAREDVDAVQIEVPDQDIARGRDGGAHRAPQVAGVANARLARLARVVQLSNCCAPVLTPQPQALTKPVSAWAPGAATSTISTATGAHSDIPMLRSRRMTDPRDLHDMGRRTKVIAAPTSCPGYRQLPTALDCRRHDLAALTSLSTQQLWPPVGHVARRRRHSTAALRREGRTAPTGQITSRHPSLWSWWTAAVDLE